MNGKTRLTLALGALAGLVAGAALLYGRLSVEVPAAPLAAAPVSASAAASASAAPDASSEAPVEPSGESAEPMPEEKKGVPTPDFTLLDAGKNSVALSDYFGKPIVLNFWASWCGPCRQEMPEFEALFKELGDEVQFVMVNLTDGKDETVESASAFIAESGYTFPIFFDAMHEGSIAYAIRGIPTTYFIDAKGCAQSYYLGSISAQALRDAVEAIRK